MKMKRWSTSVRRYIFIADSSSTTGAGLASLVFNSAGLVAYYIAGDLSNEVSITLATATLGTFASGGFVAVDNTNMPGWYEIGIPDAALDAGNEVAIQFRGATNMVPVNIYIELDTVDYQSDAFGALKPTTASRTLDVSAAGNAGIDWSNVEAPTTTLVLSGTTVKTATDVETDTADIQSRIPAALTANGNMKSSILEFITTAITEGTVGRIAAAWQGFWNVTSPVATAQSVNQTGDSFARIGVAGAGLTAIGDTRLNNLDVAVSVIQSQVTALNNLSAKTNWFGYPLLEVPDSSTRSYVFELVVKDDEDKLVNLDALPTIALTNAAGTDRSALITTGVANLSTGRYTITITVGVATVNESLKLTATGTISAETRYASYGTQVVDYDTATLINQILTTLGVAGAGLTNLGDTRLANLNATISSRATQTSVDTIDGIVDAILVDTGTDIPASIATESAKITTLVDRLGAWTGTGINTVLGAFRAIAAKAAALTPTDLSTGTGYLNTTDSLEAIRDRGDVAWITGAGGGGGGGSPVFTAVVVARIATGSTAGWPADLTIGDGYLAENASAPILFIKDVDDNILSGLGTKLFSDADFVGTLRLAPLTDSTRALDSPPTTIEVDSNDSPGILYNDDTVGAEYFELQIPQAKTLLGVTKTRYSCQFIMNWGVDETFERTVNLGEIKFLRKNAAAA